MAHPYLEIEEIHESRDGARVRLRLAGELDLDSARPLKHRLDRLRDARRHVRLDLSELTFIDSSGVHLLVDVAGEARGERWRFEVAGELPRQVERVLRLVDVPEALIRRPAGARPPGVRPAPEPGPGSPARRSSAPVLSP